MRKSVEYMISIGAAVADIKVNNNINEISLVKQRISAIENGATSNPGEMPIVNKWTELPRSISSSSQQSFSQMQQIVCQRSMSWIC